jgi:hypothetical protein
MPLFRRLALLASVGVGAAVLAAPAFGAFARPGGLPNMLGTTHFLVHYESDPATAFKITQTQAGDVAALAERAYAAELADGYVAPLSDGVLGGDSRTDIYVGDLTSFPGVIGLTEWDANTPQTSAFVILSGAQPTLGLALDQHTIAHELFHVLQLSVWLPPQISDYWLLEGSAEWMGYRANAYRTDHPLSFGPSDMSLDCRDPLGFVMCDLTDSYKNNGYSRWPFFEYLTELYGTSFVEDVFAQGAAGAPSAVTALANALVAKGTTLADAYNAWTAVDLASLYIVPALQGRTPVRYGGAIATGAKTASLTTTKVPVNHLSTRILEFDRGDGDDSHACFAATLSLTVTIPAGTQSQPVFWWNGSGDPPLPLAVNGNTAVAAIPWDTCKWPASAGYLALPNASQNVDAADFAVSGSLNVDTSQPTSVVAPPAQIPTLTPVVPVSSLEVAPLVDVAGSEFLRLGANERIIRLLVESSGDGKLHAMLGGVDLGSPTLRAGNNDVRLTLPTSALSALRRAASATKSVLTLTAISPRGTQTGDSVTRHVVVAKPAKKKHPRS